MFSTLIKRPLSWCAAGAIALAVNPSLPKAQEPAPKPAPKQLDPSKGKVVERGTSNIVANRTTTSKPSEDNPTVEPGKVRWHANLDAASNASAKSGKPILIFHMLGQLDKQFC